MQIFIVKLRLSLEKRGRSRSESNYILILRIVGMSSKPLSSRQIEIKFTKDQNVPNPHVYFMLGKLFETTSESIRLFAWEKFPGQHNYNLKVLRKLNWVFKLKWSLLEKRAGGSTNELIDIRKSDDDKIITIEHGRGGKVVIERSSGLDKENKNNATVTLTHIYPQASNSKQRKHRLTIKKTNGKLYVSVELAARVYPIRYLDAVFKKEPKDLVEAAEMGGTDNSRNWRMFSISEALLDTF
jgi:hypothetical protein